MTCRAFSRAHKVIFVDGSRILDLRVCGADGLDERSDAALVEIEGILDAPFDRAPCKPSGPILVELAQRLEPGVENEDVLETVPTQSTIIYESGAWQHTARDAAGKPLPATGGCTAEADMTRLRTSFARARWKVTQAPVTCAARSPTFVELSLRGKVVWTDRLCSGMTLDEVSRRAVELLAALIAQLEKPAP